LSSLLPSFSLLPLLKIEANTSKLQAEKLLRTAGDGNAPALSKIYTLLRLQHQQSEHSRQVCKPTPPREPPPRVSPYPGAPKLLDIRPLPLEQLSGRRHVPALTQTNGYAFLRTRKPQSPYLSRVLRDKIKQKDKRFNTVYKLERDIEDGNDESKWEEIVLEQLKKEGKGKGEREWREGVGSDWGRGDGTWVAASVRARMQIMDCLNFDLRRAREHGERLTEVWVKERKLWRQERGRRRREKHLEKKQMKEATKVGKGDVNDEAGVGGGGGGAAEETQSWRPMGH
jgi:hypothetical protein